MSHFNLLWVTGIEKITNKNFKCTDACLVIRLSSLSCKSTFFLMDSMRLRLGLSKFSFSFAGWLYVRLCQWWYQRETESLDKRKEVTFFVCLRYKGQGLRSNGSLLRQQWLVPVFSFFLFLFFFSAQPDPVLLYHSEVSIPLRQPLLKGLSPSSAEVSLWNSMAPGTTGSTSLLKICVPAPWEPCSKLPVFNNPSSIPLLLQPSGVVCFLQFLSLSYLNVLFLLFQQLMSVKPIPCGEGRCEIRSESTDVSLPSQELN